MLRAAARRKVIKIRMMQQKWVVRKTIHDHNESNRLTCIWRAVKPCPWVYHEPNVAALRQAWPQIRGPWQSLGAGARVATRTTVLACCHRSRRQKKGMPKMSALPCPRIITCIHHPDSARLLWLHPRLLFNLSLLVLLQHKQPSPSIIYSYHVFCYTHINLPYIPQAPLENSTCVKNHRMYVWWWRFLCKEKKSTQGHGLIYTKYS